VTFVIITAGTTNKHALRSLFLNMPCLSEVYLPLRSEDGVMNTENAFVIYCRLLTTRDISCINKIPKATPMFSR